MTRNGNRSVSIFSALMFAAMATTLLFAASPFAKATFGEEGPPTPPIIETSPAVEPPAEKPVEKPTEKPEEKPADKPPAKNPSDEPATTDRPTSEKPAAEEPAAEETAATARKPMKLPGLVIDFRERCVDVEATVCLAQGMLELIACTKETKEHESIVVVEARPMHIHTGLLVLGANSGHPAMRRPIDEEQTRWIDLPPKGDPVDVFLVFKDKKGKMVDHPINRFVVRGGDDPDGMYGGGWGGAAEDDDELKFPNTFLFAGSLLHDDGSGKRKYLADETGSVISIATFGDELLCLPGIHDKGNQALMWQVDAADLPRVGTKVTLRLRPKNKPAKKPSVEKKAK